MTAALSLGAIFAKHEIGEMAEVLRLAQIVIDVADGDARKGDLFLGSPLAFALGAGRRPTVLGIWAGGTTSTTPSLWAGRRCPLTLDGLYVVQLHARDSVRGVLPDGTALRDTAETLEIAEQSGDDWALFALELPGVLRSSIGEATGPGVGFE